jgi:murein DD-endopeptidase MepM/ murein hydrolase activator NlpD
VSRGGWCASAFLFLSFRFSHVLIGGATITAGMTSYVTMLWKVTDYNSLRRQQTILSTQYGQLQTRMGNTLRSLDALQSLAGDLTVAYGGRSYTLPPFASSTEESSREPALEFRHSVEEFEYLESASLATGQAGGILQTLPGSRLGDLEFIPSLWPVKGRITALFGQRLDPFSGEGSFHTGIDIASYYGDAIRAAAEGTVTFVGQRAGYGNVIVIDHGFGYTTLYAHLSRFSTQGGVNVKRGDVIGYEGQSGRATGPHLHYEVRINNEPVNPWPFLHILSNSPENVTDTGD